VSATNAERAADARPRGLRRYRFPALYVLTAAVALLLGGGLYWRFVRSEPEPPEVELRGLDPAIVAAVEEARAAVRRSPRSAAAWGRLGMVLVVHDFRAPAQSCFAEAERLDPLELRWPYYQAMTALIGADAAGAVPKLERSVDLCGDRTDAPRLRLAEALLSLDRLDEAETHFRYLLQLNPRHARAQLGLARLAYQRGDARACLEPLRQAQNDPRTQKAACLLLAEIHQQLGNPAEAEEARRRAAGLPEDQPWPDPLNDEVTELRTGKTAWIRLARRYWDQGRAADSLALLRRAVNTYPDADDAWLQLGTILLKHKDTEAAVQAMRRAVELAPRAHENVFGLGLALVAQEDTRAATACFRKAVELKPDFAPAHYNLGNCLFHAADPDGAIEAYRMAIRCEPNLFDAHLNLAVLLAGRGQRAEALVHARHALQVKPFDPGARSFLGCLGRSLAFPHGVP
jgi:tetratricopeptide (TPR) repeat protein